MPWEVILFGKDEKLGGGVPETFLLPDALLTDIGNARDAAMIYLNGYQNMTFASMSKVLQAKEDDLRCYCKSFATLTINFLRYHAEPLAEKMIRASIMNALPAADKLDVTYAQSLDAILNVMADKKLLACDEALLREVDSCKRHLESLFKGLSPTRAQLATFSPFSRNSLDAASISCRLV
jgi:hypothetical protein